MYRDKNFWNLCTQSSPSGTLPSVIPKHSWIIIVTLLLFIRENRSFLKLFCCELAQFLLKFQPAYSMLPWWAVLLAEWAQSFPTFQPGEALCQDVEYQIYHSLIYSLSTLAIHCFVVRLLTSFLNLWPGHSVLPAKGETGGWQIENHLSMYFQNDKELST